MLHPKIQNAGAVKRDCFMHKDHDLLFYFYTHACALLSIGCVQPAKSVIWGRYNKWVNFFGRRILWRRHQLAMMLL